MTADQDPEEVNEAAQEIDDAADDQFQSQFTPPPQEGEGEGEEGEE